MQMDSNGGLVLWPVPMASVLEPLLFMTKVTDVFHIISHGTPITFRDGIKIVYKFTLADKNNTILSAQQKLTNPQK